MMKESAYNVWVPKKTEDGSEEVIFNTLYGSMTSFMPNEAQSVRTMLRTGNAPTKQALRPIFGMLKRQKHLIADKVDELAIISNRQRRGISDRNRLDVIIMPTMQCNFACKYCYEKPKASTMSDDTEKAIRIWLASEIPHHKVLMLSWFGGEPMLELRRVLSISRFARMTASRHKVQVVMHMTTNGYLLTGRNARTLLAAGVNDFQITLDGSRRCHDRMRVLRNGGPTFDTIARNIIILAKTSKLIRISLRVNFNHENLDDVPTLLKVFPCDIRSQLRLVLEPIFGDCSVSAVANLDASAVATITTQIYRKAANMGYKVTLASSQSTEGKLVYCYAERRNQVIINYNGDVFKCSVCEFDPAGRVGFIGSNGTLVREKAWNQWVAELPFSAMCKACKYLPLCMGGCRKVRLRQDKGGSICSLVPTNASEVLKRIAWGDLGTMIA